MDFVVVEIRTFPLNIIGGCGPGLHLGEGSAMAAPASSESLGSPGVQHAAGRSRLGKVVIGSGWWCGERPHDWAIGSPATRTVEFF